MRHGHGGGFDLEPLVLGTRRLRGFGCRVASVHEGREGKCRQVRFLHDADGERLPKRESGITW
ncbi:hypothetical protein MINT15_25580 [Saccharomonospora viridis]|jgi:hypothetical protein|uniref:Uncharacterized protein n=1 Tax=Saccharomonospora viridis TaxID=1852 RepID=A0A837D7R4_9PSEU|nr:hypothetical protein MINT15_25580 [Saccharomonospora viridis]